ncbi:MAG: glycosyl hydrolase family 28-related protein [Puniceicoccales bacterium]
MRQFTQSARVGAAMLIGIVLPLLVQAQPSSAVQCFNVRAYGAVGDGSHDDTQAILAAVREAAQSGEEAEVFFPEGEYRVLGEKPAPVAFWHPDVAEAARYAETGYQPQASLWFSGLSGIRLKGEGRAELKLNPRLGGLWFSDCSNVTINGLTIDFSPLPFTQGTVVGIDSEQCTFDMRVDAGYPAPTEDYFQQAPVRRGMLFVAVTGELIPRNYDRFIGAVTHLDGHVFRIEVNTQKSRYGVNGIALGDRFVALARGYGSALTIRDSSGFRFEGVTVWSSPTMAFAAYNCTNTAYVNCVVAPPPGSNRLISTNGDGIHYKGSREGVVVEQCDFSRMSDDSVNIGVHAPPIIDAPAPDEVWIEPTTLPRVGDHVSILDAMTGRSRAEREIVSLGMADKDGKEWLVVGLNAPVEEIRTAASSNTRYMGHYDNGRMAATGRVVEGGLPDLLALRDALRGEFRIANNVFHENRGNGVLIRSAGVVEANRFENLTGSGIVLVESMTWRETGDPHDITIRDNDFSQLRRPDIIFSLLTARREISRQKVFKNIIISGNDFAAVKKPATLVIRNADGVRIEDNQFSPSGSLVTPESWVKLDWCRDVVIKGNFFPVEENAPGQLVKTGVGVETDTIVIDQEGGQL